MPSELSQNDNTHLRDREMNIIFKDNVSKSQEEWCMVQESLQRSGISYDREGIIMTIIVQNDLFGKELGSERRKVICRIFPQQQYCQPPKGEKRWEKRDKKRIYHRAG